MFEASDIETARKLAQEVINEFGSIAEKAVETLENGLEDSIAVLNLPEYYRKRLRTTNSVERLNEEIRRRERVIRIFPNQDSAIRLIGVLLVEIMRTGAREDVILIWMPSERPFCPQRDLSEP